MDEARAFHKFGRFLSIKSTFLYSSSTMIALQNLTSLSDFSLSRGVMRLGEKEKTEKPVRQQSLKKEKKKGFLLLG